MKVGDYIKITTDQYMTAGYTFFGKGSVHQIKGIVTHKYPYHTSPIVILYNKETKLNMDWGLYPECWEPVILKQIRNRPKELS